LQGVSLQGIKGWVQKNGSCIMLRWACYQCSINYENSYVGSQCKQRNRHDRSFV